MRRRLPAVFVLCVALLAARPAAAASVTLAWDANTESNLAGYIVQYGPASAPFTISVDVGNVTTWTFTGAASGTAYAFQVVAYNANGEKSAASGPVYANADGSVPPTLTADRTSLVFGFVTSSAQPRTRTQTIHLTQAGAGSVSWTAQSSAPWLQVSATAGTGSGGFAVSLVPSLVPSSNASATLTITAPGAANVIQPIAVTLDVLAPSATHAPFGSFDTPVDNTGGVTGSLTVTGWALDDVGISRVRIGRDPAAGEAAGQVVYIGDATLVDDARPDVAVAFPTYPDNYRTGWGYLLLTNMLPNAGNGTFRLYAYADDVDGHSTLLGTKTFTATNATATSPFGTIDTPAPGETVSGVVTNFGWVLSPGTARADGAGGGTVSVLIDGITVGSPAGWTARRDLTPIFPLAQYSGINFAEGVFGFDSTAFADGLHTIAWVVTDSHGTTQGVGSRFFRVFNGTGPAPGLMAAEHADVVAAEYAEIAPVEARRGFDLSVPFQTYFPDATGRATVQAEEVDRVEVKTAGASDGYMQARGDLRPLPVGSHLDPATGVFVWQPPPGFVGAYDLTFVRGGSAPARQDVRIVLNPKGSNRVGPQLVVDIVRPFVGGWAADLDSPSGTGISTIHVWAYPIDPSAGSGPAAAIFLGVATYGGDRPDVGSVYGDRFRASGFGISIAALPPGTYDLAIFPWSTVRGGFSSATVVRVVVK